MAQVPSYSVMSAAYTNMEWRLYNPPGKHGPGRAPADPGVYLCLIEESQGMFLFWDSDNEWWERIEPPCAGDSPVIITNVTHFVPSVCRQTSTGGYVYGA